MGREFVIHKCQEERGSKDDIGVWIPLRDAQELLDRPEQLNAILALECVCVGDAGVARVRADVAACLPDTKVVELGTKVLARSEARARVGEEAVQAMKRERANRDQLQAEGARAAALVVPGVCAACGAWVFLLALLNARGRRSEIGILRAIGYRTSRILALLLLRYVLAGLMGASLGICMGVILTALFARAFEVPFAEDGMGLSWQLAGATLAITSLLSVVAGWIPALLALRQDPAEVFVET
jgi:putative ABC transport system permease protein